MPITNIVSAKRHLSFAIMIGIAISAGWLAHLSFTPNYNGWLAILGLTSILIIWQISPLRQAIYLTFAWGLGLFTSGTYWLYISMHDYSNLNHNIALITTAVCIIYQTAFILGATYIFKKFYHNRYSPLIESIYTAALISITQIIRAHMTAFPWLIWTWSQADTALSSFVPILGIHGTNFMIILVAVSLAQILTQRQVKSHLIVIIGIILAANLASQQTWTHPQPELTAASIIQPNLTPREKWHSYSNNQLLANYLDLTSSELANSDLIIWPEGAIPSPVINSSSPDDEPKLLQQLKDISTKYNTSILFGAITQNPLTNKYYNSTIMLTQDYRTQYNKRKLVPWGEFIPLAKHLGPVLDFFGVPMSNITPGAQSQPLMQINNLKIANLLCIEIAFPDLLKNQILSGTNAIIAITDNSWFGHSSASAQLLNIAKITAKLAGRMLILDSMAGPSAVISPTGKIISQTSQFKPATLHFTIQGHTGLTPYWRYSLSWKIHLFLIMLALIMPGLHYLFPRIKNHKI